VFYGGRLVRTATTSIPWTTNSGITTWRGRRRSIQPPSAQPLPPLQAPNGAGMIAGSGFVVLWRRMARLERFELTRRRLVALGSYVHFRFG
jgi:hypothetical protein